MRRELRDEALGFEFHAFILIADGQGGSGLVEFLGDSPGDERLLASPKTTAVLPAKSIMLFLYP